MMRRRPGRVLEAAAAGLVVLVLAAGLPGALVQAWEEVGRFVQTRESLPAARARLYGADYCRAIDQIRAALPASEGYLLVEGGRPGSGGAYWVRYDLAPRPAVFLGSLQDLTSGTRLRRRLSSNLRRVVVAFDTGEPPRLYDRYRFVEEIDRGAFAGTGDR